MSTWFIVLDVSPVDLNAQVGVVGGDMCVVLFSADTKSEEGSVVERRASMWSRRSESVEHI